MLNQIWLFLRDLFVPNRSDKPTAKIGAEIKQVEIRKLWQQKTATGAPALWAEVQNNSKRDFTFDDLALLLVYTAHGGGGLMRGGHATMALTISLPQSGNLPIPAQQATTLCLYRPGDPLEIAPPKKRADSQLNNVLERDYLRFQAGIKAEGHLLGALTADPQAIWIELRVPDRRRRDVNAGRILRHDSYKRPSVR